MVEVFAVVLAGVVFGYAYAPLSRVVGIVFAVLGGVALVQGSPVGAAALAGGTWLWFVGSWTLTFHNPRVVSSRAARVLFVHTPLKWTLPAP